MTPHATKSWQRPWRLSGLLIALALLAAACNPATPPPTATPIPLLNATAISQIAPTATPPPSDTPTPELTDTEEPIAPDDQVTAVVATGTVIASELDACALLTDEEAAALLGGPALSKTPGVDEDQGYVLNFCTWLGSGQAIVVSVANTGSEASSLAYILAGDSDEATLTQENDLDLGPNAFWTTTEHAAGYDVAYGPNAFSVTIGGQVTATDDLKAQLLKLAKAVAGRLGG